MHHHWYALIESLCSVSRETSIDAITTIRSRRSTRKFSDRAVERTLLAELIADAAHAPFTPIAKTGAWHFTAILGSDRLSSFGERALAFARQQANGPGWEWTTEPGFLVFHAAPAAVVISGRIELPSALEECTRAGQLLDISATARGLGACWVGSPMPWLGEPTTRMELGIPAGWAPKACFVLGWPDTECTPTPQAPRPPHDINWIEG